MHSAPSSASSQLEDKFPQLLARIEQRERTARTRTLLFSLVPVVIAAALLGYTGYAVREAASEVDTLQRETVKYQMQIGQLQQQKADLEEKLAEAERRLLSATDMQQFVKPVSLVDVKSIASRFPQEARVLELILRMREQNVRWHLGGTSPSQGFDSPSFAAFVLERMDLLRLERRPGETLLQTSRRLYERLEPVPNPQVGDLVFYPSGYVLFHFADERNEPFVIGMTPFGITALKSDFALPVGYRRLPR